MEKQAGAGQHHTAAGFRMRRNAMAGSGVDVVLNGAHHTVYFIGLNRPSRTAGGFRLLAAGCRGQRASQTQNGGHLCCLARQYETSARSTIRSIPEHSPFR